MENILEKLESYEKIMPLLDYIYGLNETEIKVLIFVVACLIAIMTLKWFGVKVFLTLLFLYLIFYVMYNNDFLNQYKERENKHNEHMDMIEDYMPGKD